MLKIAHLFNLMKTESLQFLRRDKITYALCTELCEPEHPKGYNTEFNGKTSPIDS